MVFKTGPAILIAIALLFPISSLNAEDNKNYADCDICHGGIHYGNDETKAILGKQCLELFPLLTDRTKTIKLDLDGVRKPGSKESSDAEYEIMIWGESPFYVKDLRDGSTILIVNRVANLNQSLTMDNWKPEIYLYASEFNEIDLKDPLDTAWEKFKASGIYFWVISENKDADWNGILRSKILEALKLMTGK